MKVQCTRIKLYRKLISFYLSQYDISYEADFPLFLLFPLFSIILRSKQNLYTDGNLKATIYLFHICFLIVLAPDNPT